MLLYESLKSAIFSFNRANFWATKPFPLANESFGGEDTSEGKTTLGASKPWVS